MATLLPADSNVADEKDAEDKTAFEFFPSQILSYMTEKDAQLMYDPESNGSLSCALTIGMLFLSMIFAFGWLTTIYWLLVPTIRYGLTNDEPQIIYIYLLYIPLGGAISWLIAVIICYKTNREKYNYYTVNGNDWKYLIWIYILFLFNPIALRWKYIDRCIWYCRLYQSALYYSINSFIHQKPKEMMERIIAIHYYLTNRYYELWTKHIVRTIKDNNGNRYGAYRIASIVEKFTTGIKDFKQALYDEELNKNVDSLALAKDIETKLKYKYDKSVMQLFPLFALVAKEVESNISSQCEVDKDQFNDIVNNIFLQQKGAFRHAFISFDFMPYKIISCLVFLAYFILNWYVLLTLYDGTQSFAENTRYDLLLPSLYDFVLVITGIILIYIDKRYLVHDTLSYIVRFYGDWNKIENLLIMNEGENVYDIFETRICPIYSFYGGRFVAIQLSVNRFGDDIGSIIIQFLYGDEAYEQFRNNQTQGLIKIDNGGSTEMVQLQ